MSSLDWIIMGVTLLAIIIYGVIQSKGQKDANTFILAGGSIPWHTVLIGIMATQASAITFLSGPGQAYSDGMRFIQYYFGLPIAMVLVAAIFVPIFRKSNVFTAYEYLDQRFDKKTRLFTGILFLFSRGVSTGFSIYAPAIILTTLLHLNINISILLVGGMLIIYSYMGGAVAIAKTQKIQFAIIISAMIVAGILIIKSLPTGVGFNDALFIAGKAGKLNVITTKFDIKDQYNIWSGIIGGFFLSLSYFGTDQSQVGRYLSAKDATESKLGLLLNGMVKIPMQFGILLIGALLFSFYTFHKAPISFNPKTADVVSLHNPTFYQTLSIQYNLYAEQSTRAVTDALSLHKMGNNPIATNNAIATFQENQKEMKHLRDSLSNYISDNHLNVEPKDTNYIFLHYVKNYLPVGMIGVLMAVVFLASWGSIAAALNSLASSSLIDFQKVIFPNSLNKENELKYARLHTLLWGIFGIIIAMFATQMDSLIEAVNKLGSLFYGTILGIFLTAFFIKRIKGTAVFIAAILSELCICYIYYKDVVAFLWLNMIGALLVCLFAIMIQPILNSKKK